MGWLCAISNNCSLDVTDGARLVGRRGRSPQAEVGLYCPVRLPNIGRRAEVTYQTVDNECLTLGTGTLSGRVTSIVTRLGSTTNREWVYLFRDSRIRVLVLGEGKWCVGRVGVRLPFSQIVVSRSLHDRSGSDLWVWFSEYRG